MNIGNQSTVDEGSRMDKSSSLKAGNEKEEYRWRTENGNRSTVTTGSSVDQPTSLRAGNEKEDCQTEPVHQLVMEFRGEAVIQPQAPLLPGIPDLENGLLGNIGQDQTLCPVLDPEPAEQIVEPVQNLIPYIEENDIRLQADIVNLSSARLTNDQLEVLGLGLKFRRTMPKVPVLQLTAGTEMVAREMEQTDPIEANTFRIACSNTIQWAQPPSGNLDKKQRQALRKLRENQALAVLTADKGGKMVVLDLNQYTSVCLAHLECDAYELVTSFRIGRTNVVLRSETDAVVEEFSSEDFKTLDPSDKLLKMQCKKLTDVLTKFKNNGQISATDRKKCIPSRSVMQDHLRTYQICGLVAVRGCMPF